MRVLLAFTLIASGSNARRVQNAFAEESTSLLEQMQGIMADPSFQEQAGTMAKPMLAIITEASRMQIALSDPGFQDEMMRVLEPIAAMMMDGRLQKVAKHVAEQLRALMTDPSFRSEYQRIVKPLMTFDLASQGSAPVLQQLQAVIADPNFQEQAKRAAEPMLEMMSNKDLQEDVTIVMEQMKAIMSDSKFQKEARRASEPLVAMMTQAKQMRKMMAGHNLQEEVKRVAQPMLEMMSNKDLWEDVKIVVEQMTAIMPDPKFQKLARRASEQLVAMMTQAKQMGKMMAGQNLQEEAERGNHGRSHTSDQMRVSSQQKSLASVLLASNPSLAGAVRPRVASATRWRPRDIERKVLGIIVEQLGVDPAEVTPDASFKDDLFVDSLDLVELVIAFEEVFDIEIPDEEAESMATPADCVTAIEAKLE